MTALLAFMGYLSVLFQATVVLGNSIHFMVDLSVYSQPCINMDYPRSDCRIFHHCLHCGNVKPKRVKRRYKIG